MSLESNITQLAAIGAIAIALLGNLGVFAYSITTDQKFRSERASRIQEVNVFLKRQCDRDQFRDQVVIQALKDAQDRARASISDPNAQSAAVEKLQITINKLESLHGKCIAQLP